MHHVHRRSSIVLCLAIGGGPLSGCGDAPEPSVLETETDEASASSSASEGETTAVPDPGPADATSTSTSSDASTSITGTGTTGDVTGDPEDTGTTTTTETDTAGAHASPGCGQPLAEGWLSDHALAQGGTTSVAQVQIDGSARSFLVGLPPDYDPDHAYPVHMVFHALTGTMDHAYGLDVAARWHEPVIALAPQGHPYGSNGYAWNWSNENGADHRYVRAMIEDVEQHLCVDTDRIFGSGTSNGAYMANAVACFTGLLRGMGASAGGMPIDAAACVAPTTAFLMHGTADTVVPLSAGLGARNKWLNINGCADTTTPAVDNRCQHYGACSSGADVYWCVHDGTHPQSNPNSLGFSAPMISIFESL